MDWVPDMMLKFDHFPLTFIDRMKNAVLPAYWSFERRFTMHPEFDRIMKQAFGRDNIPPFAELEKNVSLIFINSHPSFDFALTLPPFAIMMGGINAYLPEKAIPAVRLSISTFNFTKAYLRNCYRNIKISWMEQTRKVLS